MSKESMNWLQCIYGAGYLKRALRSFGWNIATVDVFM